MRRNNRFMPHDPELFSIGEFSQITGLSVKTLRFYDEKDLLKPAQVDETTSYRYYNAASVDRARMIALLREMQFSLRDIGAILNDCEDQSDLLAYLERQRRTIEQRIRADRATSKKLERMIAEEREADRIARRGEFAIEEKKLEPILVAGIRMNGRYADCGAGFSRIAREMGKYLGGKPLCLYYDGEYREEDADFEPCIPLRREASITDGLSVRTLPAIHCLTLVHQGPYRQLGRSYRRILTEAKRRGISLSVPTREVYIKGPGMIFKGNPDRYLTEIQLPIVEP
jgi:DNA-binding transcriptional MerR regulator